MIGGGSGRIGGADATRCAEASGTRGAHPGLRAASCVRGAPSPVPRRRSIAARARSLASRRSSGAMAASTGGGGIRHGNDSAARTGGGGAGRRPWRRPFRAARAGAAAGRRRCCGLRRLARLRLLGGFLDRRLFDGRSLEDRLFGDTLGPDTRLRDVGDVGGSAARCFSCGLFRVGRSTPRRRPARPQPGLVTM